MRAFGVALAAAVASILSATLAAAAEWLPVAGIPSDHIEIFYVDGTDLFAGTISGEVFVSADHGTSWTEIAGGFPPTYSPVGSIARVDDALIMSRDFSETDLNYRTWLVDGEWSNWETLPDQDDKLASMVTLDGVVFATHGDLSLYRSDDQGTTWMPVALPAGIGAWKLQTHENDLYFFAGRTIYWTTDQGATWNQVEIPSGISFITSLTFHHGGVVLAGSHGGGVGSLWRATALGAAWTEITTLPSLYHANGLATMSDGRLVAGLASGSDGGSIFTTSSFDAWDNATGDLPAFSQSVNDLFTHDGWIFKTGGSATAYRASEATAVAVDSDLPTVHAFTPLTVSPNPMAARATLVIDAGKAGDLRIDVFDATGRRVDTIFDGRTAAGRSAHEWDASDVPSGVYFLVGRLGHEITRASVRVVR